MKYVGKCPNCQTEITVIFETKPTRTYRHTTEGDLIKLGAEPVVLDYLKEAGSQGRYPNEIWQHVLKAYPAWRWKKEIVGFVVAKLAREGKIKRVPVIKPNNRLSSVYTLADKPVEMETTRT